MGTVTAADHRLGSWRDRLGAEGALAAYGGPLAAVLIALRLTRGAWGARAAAGDDVMAHLVRSRWGIDKLLLHGHLDGWMPSFALGYQEFLFFGPGFTWLIGLIRLLTLGQLSNAGALKVLTIGSFVAFPLVVVFLARSYGLSRRAAGLAAPLALLVSNPFGIGLQALFQVALIPQQVGAVFACLSLGSLLRLVAEPRRRWVALAVASSAALVVTHVISVFIVALLFVVSAPALLLTDRPRRRVLVLLAWTAMGIIGLAGFWLVPFLAHRNLHGPTTTWSTPPLASRLGDIFAGRYLLRPHVAVIVLAGAVFGLARVARRRRWALALVSAPIGYVAVSRLALHRYPANEIAIQIENRGIGYVAVIATFSLAAVIAWAARRAGRPGDVVAVLVVAGLALVTAGPWQRIAAQQPLGSPQLHDAAREIAARVPPGARYTEVRQFPADVQSGGGVSHPDFWLAAESGRPALNEFNVESSSTPEAAFVPEHLLDQSADLDADALARLGVTDVVTTTDQARTHLLSSSRFREVWAEAPFAVLEVHSRPGQPDPASLVAVVPSAPAVGAGGQATPAAPAVTARLVRSLTNRLRIVVDTSSAVTITVAVAWSPKWQATVAGRPAPLGHSGDGLLRLTLPPGRSAVELRFRRDRWDVLGPAVTLLAALLAVGWAWPGPRRARSGPSSGRPAGSMAP